MSAFHLTSILASLSSEACLQNQSRLHETLRAYAQTWTRISVAALPRSLALPVAGSFGIRPSKIRYQARPMPARTSATSFFRISNLS
jgi:hypothetical protein